MTASINKWWLWLALNAGGIALFFALAVKTWIEPQLANVPGTSGGAAFVWGVSALPVFLLFIVANLVAGFIALRRRHGAIFVALTLVAWIAAVYFDGIHHGI
jgi:hypothetical protein